MSVPIKINFALPPQSPRSLQDRSVEDQASPRPTTKTHSTTKVTPSPAKKKAPSDEDEEMEDITFFHNPLEKDEDFPIMDASKPMCMTDAAERMEVDD
ncbi:hypothetical protein BGX23_011067 [Mortierella sp. AD031]|nr:hypothetical protein BGX23_011067 [Mortierella sp. AD031]